MAALCLQHSVGWGSARLFALLALACCSSICSTHGVAAQGFPIQVHEVALLAASAGGKPDQQLDVRRVDYNDRQVFNNTIDYCGNAFCGPCAMLPDDPCKVSAPRTPSAMQQGLAGLTALMLVAEKPYCDFGDCSTACF